MKKKTLLTKQAQEFAESLSMRSQVELRRLRDKLEEDADWWRHLVIKKELGL